MRVVVAPQEFKGSLTAVEAARAMAAGVIAAVPGAEIEEAPMSDGGPGFVDVMLAAGGGERVERDVHDPLMRPVRAIWGILAGGSAVIEMAAASGLVLLSAEERGPLLTTSYGAGELIRAALDRGCTHIIVGVGGSATVDGGAGAMQALGARLLDADGRDLPPGGAALGRLARIDLTGRDPRLDRITLRVASDVTNPLCGPEGAAAVFAPQKGASPDEVLVLDAALRRFAEIVSRDAGVDLLSLPGGGAAGGLGAGLVAIARATIEPGFALVAQATRLEEKIARAHAIITGEGRLDAQTAYGKTAAGVAALAARHNVPVAIVAGSIRTDFDASTSPFAVVEALVSGDVTLEAAIHEPSRYLREATTRVMRGLIAAGAIPDN